jgi:hypothetical protein
MTQPCYVLDSTVVIDLCGHFRRSVIQRGLESLAKQSRLKIPEGVQRELKRRTDNASRIVDALVRRHSDSVVQVGRVSGLGDELARVERTYGENIQVGSREYAGFWKSARGRKAVDGQVVAMAGKLGCTLVSDDVAVRLACMLENIPCIGWTELARAIGLHAQPSLFPDVRGS